VIIAIIIIMAVAAGLFIKSLKSEIRELKSKKPALLNSTLQWEHDPVDIDALIEHFKRNKYG